MTRNRPLSDSGTRTGHDRNVLLRVSQPISTAMPILVHRKASEIDYELLRSMRVECGWGLEKLEKYWNDPHRVYCVFQTDSGSDVGMGCWILEDEDPELASKATDSVYICELCLACCCCARDRECKMGFGIIGKSQLTCFPFA